MLGAASCWGTIGVVYALLPRWVAIGPVTIVFLRATSAFAILLAFTATARRDALRVNWRELPFLALFGLVSIAAFYVVLIYAFRSASVGVTTVLLYLAPAFVTVVSALALREPLSASKLLALGCCLTGAILVAEPWAGQGLRVGVKGLVLGLLSALTYGSYSLLGKVGLRRHRPLTLVLYGLGFGALGLLPIQVVAGTALPDGVALLVVALVTGVVITLIPLGLYTAALNELPSSNAAIVASFEPVVAISLAALVLGEYLRPVQLLGAAAIVAGVMVLASGNRKDDPRAGTRPGTPAAG